MAKTICLLNFKGGVGKTTIALNLCAALAHLKKRTLLVDLDVQGNSTQTLKRLSPYDGVTIFEILTGKSNTLVSYETQTPLMDYIPSSPDMKMIEQELNRRREREHILERVVAQLQDDYDYIVLDCPPGKSLIVDNAMVASDYVIAPLRCDAMSIYGFIDIINEIKDVKTYSNPKLELMGIVANEYDSRTNITRNTIESFEKNFPDKLFKAHIRSCVALREFPYKAENIFDYAPNSNGAADMYELAKEILKRAGDKSKIKQAAFITSNKKEAKSNKV